VTRGDSCDEEGRPLRPLGDAPPSLANESQGIARLIIEWDARTGRLNVAFPNSEIHCRFMMDKARAFLDDEWRKRNAPMVLPANGQSIPRVR